MPDRQSSAADAAAEHGDYLHAATGEEGAPEVAGWSEGVPKDEIRAHNGPLRPVPTAGLTTLFASYRGAGEVGGNNALLAGAALLEAAGLRRRDDAQTNREQQPVLAPAPGGGVPRSADDGGLHFEDLATGRHAATLNHVGSAEPGGSLPTVRLTLVKDSVGAEREAALLMAFPLWRFSPACRVPHAESPPYPFHALESEECHSDPLRITPEWEADPLPGFTLEWVTGSESGNLVSPDGREIHDISTRFSLKVRGVEVGVGLWTYHNRDMGTAGPTLEVIEVAEDHRRRGLGAAMYRAMEEAVLGPFRPLGAVYISACQVANRKTARFLCGHAGFRDADGWLEELSKVVYWTMGPWGVGCWQWDAECYAQGHQARQLLDRLQEQAAARSTSPSHRDDGCGDGEGEGRQQRRCSGCASDAGESCPHCGAARQGAAADMRCCNCTVAAQESMSLGTAALQDSQSDAASFTR